MAIPHPIIKRRAVFLHAILITFALLVAREARAVNYSGLLVNGLLRLDYPLEREDVVALDRISMRFNARNRFDVLVKILNDRQRIHDMEKGDDFEKTEVICNALHLLDEMDLPVTRKIIENLLEEKNWRTKERRLLCFMAAKRDIKFELNSRYLIAAMPTQKTGVDTDRNGGISLFIMDICDNLSYLTELYVYRGEPYILDALVRFAGQTYGYPKEYLSYMFTEILFQRPESLIGVLSGKDDRSLRPVVNSLLFVIMRNHLQAKVDQLFREELAGNDYSQNRMVQMLYEKMEIYRKETDAKQHESKTIH